MKRRYKLVKTYPGSPEIGEIWEKQGEYDDYYYGKSSHPWIYKELVENHPEFWEEVIEKDYEILTFGCEGGFDRTLNRYGGYSLITGRDTYPMGKKGSTLIESPNYYIKTVRRLSDGELFTIGDMCNPASTGFNYNKRPITKIWFTKFNSLRISSDNYTLPINGIEHSDVPLFTTEDGIDIYNGDKYYYVPENERRVDTITANKRFELSEYGKRFSTKKAAENYIFNSEKRFSLDDLIGAIPLDDDDDDVTTILTKMLDNLKSLAQTTKE